MNQVGKITAGAPFCYRFGYKELHLPAIWAHCSARELQRNLAFWCYNFQFQENKLFNMITHRMTLPGLSASTEAVRMQFGRIYTHISHISHPPPCSKLPHFAWMPPPVNKAALCLSYFPNIFLAVISILLSLETSTAFIKIYTFYICICPRLKKWFSAIINKQCIFPFVSWTCLRQHL